MNRPSFNVLSEPWIPVIRGDGSRDELGILGCLEQAHELREIRDPSPIVEFGLYRLLVAFLLDALILAEKRPEDPLDLKKLIEAGKFDMDMIHNYVERCGEVFDLFHPQRPFLQDSQASGEEKSIFDFYPVFPSGANVVHFSASLKEFVGEIGFGQISKCMIESDFQHSEGLETVRFSGGQFRFAVQTLHHAAGKLLFRPKPVQD